MSKAVDREALKAFRERTDERYVMEGEYSPETSVGYSDSTGAIKTEYGVELNAGATIDGHLDEPFLFRPTAYPFNRDVITIGGQKATVKQVRAYAFVKNQLITQSQQSGTWTHTRIYCEMAFGGLKVSTDSKLLIMVDAKSTNAQSRVYTVYRENGVVKETHATNYLTTNFTRTFLLINGSNHSDELGVRLRISNDGGQENTIEWQNLTVINLTQWFNNDTTILSKTNETWFVPWFLNNFGKYIPTHSTGEIENTYATKITTNGVNQWDGTNDIRVLPRTQYYCKGSATLTYKDIDGNTIDTATVSDAVFTTPDNCIYVGVSGSGNIQICLHWTETEIEQTYHPYEKWVFNIDWSAIGTPLGINSQIGDYKDFVNGKNGKVVGSVDLGTLNWTKKSSVLDGVTHYRWYANSTLSDAKAVPSQKIEAVANAICYKYQVTSFATTSWAEYPNLTDNRGGLDCISIYSDKRPRIYDKSFDTAEATAEQLKTALQGIILQYELAEPTLTDMTESEKLTNTYNVNDYGTEEFDNVCALDVLYQNNLVRQIVNNQTAIAEHEQRISALETEVAGIKGLPTAPSTNGNYRLRCTVADGVATYSWVAES